MSMIDAIIDFITQHIPLTESEIEIIRAHNIIRSYKKGTILLAVGEYATECYFVLSGSVKRYYLINGEEKGVEYYRANQGITSISYLDKKPSTYFLECAEDCLISPGSSAASAELVKKIPRLAKVMSKATDDVYTTELVKFGGL